MLFSMSVAPPELVVFSGLSYKDFALTELLLQTPPARTGQKIRHRFEPIACQPD